MKKNRRSREEIQERPRQLLLPVSEMLLEGLHEVVVRSGLEAVAELLEAERTEVCGPRYAHDGTRVARRMGHAPSELVLGGRRVHTKRPRARTLDGREVVLPSWRRWSNEDPLAERAVEQMVLGVSTRRYGRSLEPLPEPVKTRGTSKSAVSRRFVEATEEKLEAFLRQDLSDFDVVSVMIDGVHIGDHVVLVALGIDAGANKRILGFHEGATENSTACTELLGDLASRGLRTDRSVLVVIDGSKALRKAVRDVFGDRAIVQRCQFHKSENVLGHLPKRLHAPTRAALRQAYCAKDADAAKRLLTNLAQKLDEEHPSAAASLREGLDETITVKAMGLGESLERTLSTTNAIENILNGIRRVTRNVKHWQDGDMVLRWMAASADDVARGFRRLRGYKAMPKLVAILRTNDARLGIAVDSAESAA